MSSRDQSVQQMNQHLDTFCHPRYRLAVEYDRFISFDDDYKGIFTFSGRITETAGLYA